MAKAATIFIEIPAYSDAWEYEKRLTGMVAYQDGGDYQDDEVILMEIFHDKISKIRVETDRPVPKVLEEIFEAIGDHNVRVVFN